MWCVCVCARACVCVVVVVVVYVWQLVYVMPSTSGRAATYPRRADKLKFFNELQGLTDKKRVELGMAPRSELYTLENNGNEHDGSK